jgi:DNA-binding transcriptional ArsR family regulator
LKYFDMKELDVVRSLAALAQEVRLRVFRALVVAGKEGLTPGVILEKLGMTPALLSFHLKELVQAGLVTQERQGRNLIYRASFDSVNELLGYLTENCCAGQACLTDDANACHC